MKKKENTYVYKHQRTISFDQLSPEELYKELSETFLNISVDQQDKKEEYEQSRKL